GRRDAANLVEHEVEADVARAHHRKGIVDRTFGASSAEAAGVADSPAGHEAAVRASKDADPSGVDAGQCKGGVGDGRDIRPVVVTPGAENGEGPIFGVAIGTARVAVDDGVAGSGVNLELVEEVAAVLRLGAA